MPKYFNATTGPVIVDEEGRIVGGGEWFDTKQTPEIKAAISRSEIVAVSTPKTTNSKNEDSKDSSKTAGNEGA